MSFLPPNYEPPASGNYMKLQSGKNKIRILGAAIVGYQFWQTDGDKRRPVRRRMGEKIDPSELEINPRDNQREKPKHFWAFPVWNYGNKAVQILEITQASVRDGMQALINDEDWGDPTCYDISITKTGEGMDTTYGVTPSNKGTTPASIVETCAAMNINMEALFSGGDPFASAGSAKPTNGNGAKVDPKTAAWRELKIKLPGATPDKLKAEFSASIVGYVGKPATTTLTSSEWETVANNIAEFGPYVAGREGGPGIPDDEIPFAPCVC